MTVLPFRSCLVKLTSVPEKDPVTDSEHSLGRLKVEEAVDVYVSADLKEWKNLKMLGDLDSKLDIGSAGAVRYLRFYNCPLRIPENGYLCIAINGKHGEPKALIAAQG